jgi:hypothetical protein
MHDDAGHSAEQRVLVDLADRSSRPSHRSGPGRPSHGQRMCGGPARESPNDHLGEVLRGTHATEAPVRRCVCYLPRTPATRPTAGVRSAVAERSMPASAPTHWWCHWRTACRRDGHIPLAPRGVKYIRPLALSVRLSVPTRCQARTATVCLADCHGPHGTELLRGICQLGEYPITRAGCGSVGPACSTLISNDV